MGCGKLARVAQYQWDFGLKCDLFMKVSRNKNTQKGGDKLQGSQRDTRESVGMERRGKMWGLSDDEPERGR